MGMALTATATETADYLDRFEPGGWTGNDGSEDWSTDWLREGEVRLASGDMCNEGSCMQLGDLIAGGGSARRFADTSIFSERFDVRFHVEAQVLDAGGKLYVEAHDDDAWRIVKQYNLDLPLDETARLTLEHEFLQTSFGVRFRYEPLLAGGRVYVDEVQIEGQLKPPPNTTTTSTTTSSTTTTLFTTTSPPTATSTTIRSSAPITTPSTTTPVRSSVSAEESGDTSGAGSVPSTTSTTTGDRGGGEEARMQVAGETGIRSATRGVQVDFDGGLFGEVPTVNLSLDVGAVDFSMAVEVIESSWAWLAILGLVLGWSAVTGLDRRRRRLYPSLGHGEF